MQEKRRQPFLSEAAPPFLLRSTDIVNGSEAHKTTQRADLDQSSQRHLLAYSAGSGMLATVAATVTALAVTGTVRTVVWTAVLGSVSFLAGLVYFSGPLRALRIAHQVVQRARVRA
jgi:hypothetical protein